MVSWIGKLKLFWWMMLKSEENLSQTVFCIGISTDLWSVAPIIYWWATGLQLGCSHTCIRWM